jgi:hypothetical protein
MLGGSYLEFVIETVVPDLGHIIPVVDDASLDRAG